MLVCVHCRFTKKTRVFHNLGALLRHVLAEHPPIQVVATG